MAKEAMAFPGSGSANDGMQLRDYLAAKAMEALIPEVLQRCEGLGNDYPDNNRGLAKAAYEVADAMLAARASNS